MNPYDCGFQISDCGLIKQKKLEGFSKSEFGMRKGEEKKVDGSRNAECGSRKDYIGQRKLKSEGGKIKKQAHGSRHTAQGKITYDVCTKHYTHRVFRNSQPETRNPKHETRNP